MPQHQHAIHTFSIHRLLRTAGAVLCAVYLALLPLAARPAGAEPANWFGVNVHATWSDYSAADRTKMLDLAKGLGASWIRVDVGWSAMEQHGKGTATLDGAGGSKWYLNLVDSIVSQANARGLHVLATVTDSPLWARPANCSPSSPAKTSVRCAPANPQNYADFMSFFAHRYAGKIAAVELWNEPNQAAYMIPNSPRIYVGLVKAAYPAIKAAAPNMTVVAGAISANDNDFIKAMYASGAKNCFDVLSTHPYMSTSDLAPEVTSSTYNPYIMSSVNYVHATMAANGDGSKPIWFTEFGWSTHANTGAEQPWSRGVSQAAQADYTVRSLEFIKQHYSYVTETMLYMLVDDRDSPPQARNYGLYTASYVPKPVVAALQNYLGEPAAGAVADANASPTALSHATSEAGAPPSTAPTTNSLQQATDTAAKHSMQNSATMQPLSLRPASFRTMAGVFVGTAFGIAICFVAARSLFGQTGKRTR